MKIIVLLILSTFSLGGLCAEGQTWYFVRHFEKQQGPNPELTEEGKKRAVQLAKFFADIPLSHIYSTDYQRTQQTSAPVADKRALKVQAYDPRQLADFAQKLRLGSDILVVGHSNTTPELITLMGGTTPIIRESDYGQLFVLRIAEGLIEEETFMIPTSQHD
jgi:phosphohistidine phosphatase SixA